MLSGGSSPSQASIQSSPSPQPPNEPLKLSDNTDLQLSDVVEIPSAPIMPSNTGVSILPLSFSLFLLCLTLSASFFF